MAKDPSSVARAGAFKKTHGGPGLIFLGDFGTTFPDHPDDVIDFAGGVSQFTPKAGWTALGMTSGGVTVTRGFEKVDRMADQTYGPFDFRPTQWTTQVSTELVQTDLAALKYAWHGNAPAVTAAGTNSLIATNAVTINDTVIDVTTSDGADFSVGDILTVGEGASQEYVKVLSKVSDALTLTTGTIYAHAIGEPVRRLEVQAAGFGTRRIVEPQLVAIICPLVEETAGVITQGYRMYAIRKAKLDAGQRAINHSNTQDWTIPISFMAFPDLDVADMDNDTMTVIDMVVATP